MKKELNGLSDPTKFHAPVSIEGINKTILINMMKSMIIIRKTEQRLAKARKEGLIGGPVHLGAGQEAIIRELESMRKTVPRDAFGHVRLDEINPGQWFAKQFAKELGAEKTLVQKSGYFARSAKANTQDLELIKKSAFYGAEKALEKKSGLVGLDDDHNNQLCLIEFERIKGGKPFDISLDWYQSMLKEIGQN